MKPERERQGVYIPALLHTSYTPTVKRGAEIATRNQRVKGSVTSMDFNVKRFSVLFLIVQ